MSNYERLLKDIEVFRYTSRSVPVGLVLSRLAWYEFQKLAPFPRLGSPDERCTELLGTPIYDFTDVPDSEVYAFYDHEVLLRYLTLQRSIGHAAAIARLTAYVDEGLILVSTLRAILETS